MSTDAPALFRPFWRSRRAAAIAGILFGVLLLTAMVMTRIALAEGSLVVPLDGRRLDAAGIAADPALAPQLRTALDALSEVVFSKD